MPSFTQIPSTLRVPLFWAEVDASAANSGGGDNPKTLIVGQKLAAGTAAANIPLAVTSAAMAETLFGFGSELHRAYLAYTRQDPLGEVWALPIADATGTNASLSLTVTGPATENGTIPLYLAGRLVSVPVTNGDTAATIVTAIVAAITASTDPLGVTAADGAGDTVDLTHVHDGTCGNSYDVRACYLGAAGGERLPAGVGITAGGNSIVTTPATLASGATDPSHTTGITNMGDEPYDYVVILLPTTTVIAAFEAELLDRWSALKQVYSLAFTALRDSSGDLLTFGGNRNSPYISTLGYDLVPSCDAEMAAAYAGACARELKADPARPLQTVALEGVLPPRAMDVFTATVRNNLLFAGISCAHRAGGAYRITAAVSNYRENAGGNADDSYLYVETLATLRYVLRYLKSSIETKYPRSKLANDGTRFASGQAIVTPSIIRGELVASYLDLMELGLVENVDAFVENLVVERNALNPNRLDVLYPPDLVNGLRIFALLMQFRQQYSTRSVA